MKLLLEVDAKDYEEAQLRKAIEDGDITWIEEIIGGLKIVNAEEWEENMVDTGYKDMDGNKLYEGDIVQGANFIVGDGTYKVVRRYELQSTESIMRQTMFAIGNFRKINNKEEK